VAFVSGLTGEFYRQFALTIAISTVISAFNSLTLSPALAAVLLKPHDAKKDRLTRAMDRLLGGFFKRFNRGFLRTGNTYSRVVSHTVRRSAIAVVVYAGLIGLTYIGFNSVPSGFIPDQDKQYVIAIAQLPAAASLERTDEVTRKLAEIGLKTPGVAGAVQFSGMSVNDYTPTTSALIDFFALDDFDKRKSKNLSAKAIAATLTQKFASVQDAFVVVFPAPPVMGLGTLGGFKLQVEDRGDHGEQALYAAINDAVKKANQTPSLAGVFSSYQINVPQLKVNIDRTKVKQQNVKLSDVFQTLQVYLGSLYVNDFNRFGRTYQVMAQADAPYRSHVDDILPLKTRNAAGAMVPLGSLLTISQTFGPETVQRYNGYRSADISGGAAPGFSSGQAQAAMASILKQTLPRGMTFEWTDLAYQQLSSGSTAAYIFPLCVLFVFLVLAAQYESLTLPLSIILIVPMCLLAAIAGLLIDHSDNNVFTQVGLIVLVGLACKNAILIVEFARHLQEQGQDAVSAVLEAARLRLRPILMTSFAFIMGVVPLMLATGAGAEIRHALGVTVFAGMLGVTFFGLLLTPVFYVLIRRLTERRTAREDTSKSSSTTTAAPVQLIGPETHHV
jgi:multidrug efflux pump